MAITLRLPLLTATMLRNLDADSVFAQNAIHALACHLEFLAGTPAAHPAGRAVAR